MKVNYAILGSDENPFYLDFWPIVSKVWNNVFGVKPILGLICDEDSEIYNDEFGLIKKFKKIQGVDVGLQSQIVRFYINKFIDGYSLISDIDMLPLSKLYFEGSCSRLTEENLILHSSDNPECLAQKMYPMCYVAAHTETYKKVFDLHMSWEEFCTLLNSRNETWYTDQKYLYEKVNDYHKQTNNVIFLNRGWKGPANRRIDRIYWNYDPNKVKEGYYIDSHLLRPYSQYKTEIEKLSNLLF